MKLIKEIGCRDLGMNCDFITKGLTVGNVKKKILKHAEKSHAKAMQQMTEEDKTVMEQKIDEILKGGKKT